VSGIPFGVRYSRTKRLLNGACVVDVGRHCGAECGCPVFRCPVFRPVFRWGAAAVQSVGVRYSALPGCPVFRCECECGCPVFPECGCPVFPRVRVWVSGIPRVWVSGIPGVRYSRFRYSRSSRGAEHNSGVTRESRRQPGPDLCLRDVVRYLRPSSAGSDPKPSTPIVLIKHACHARTDHSDYQPDS
jgi:hypothetical protein